MNVHENTNKTELDNQSVHWENKLSNIKDMFGHEASYPAQKSLKLFKQNNKLKILELGGGQGRDTLFFAENGLQIDVLDYSQSGIANILEKARIKNLKDKIKAKQHDIRQALPYADNTFDGCYSHMLFCMALTTKELEFLSSEIQRVLKTGGINIYTVRNTNDADFKSGNHKGEDMYESNGFIVHFFSKEKIQHLAKGFKDIQIESFEEGGLPRKLFLVNETKK